MESVVVDGVRLGYERAGSGPAVVLVGGTGMPPVAWQLCGLRDTLAGAGFEVVTYAARGVAPSDAPAAPYTVDDLAADLAGLLEALGLTETVVVGYSLGSFTAELLARTRPDLVRAAVLMAGAGPLTGVLDAVLAAETELIATTGRLSPAFMRLQTLLSTLPPGVLCTDDAQVRTWLELLGAQEAVWTSAEGENGQSAASDRWLRDEHRMAALAQIAAPVLVLAFEYDLYFPPGSGRVAAAALPAGHFAQISGAAHGGLLTHSGETTKAILAFLAHVDLDEADRSAGESLG
ncbi:alpha/beta fold hydrolase [Nonomuraea spiralis]|uniref:Alpha/beta fold hydrolase n=1 Tax=Nonomuraea spiralis TaxID=46182 RepID=A0ABV5ISL3_9ACTN|nr:alpha/beta hydrolase [Nonomuraea spiralis]GGT44168.1 hydrolase [Nonomuraea spiralis]